MMIPRTDITMRMMLRLIFLVLSLILLVTCVILNGLAGPGIRPLFLNSTKEISDLFYTPITPRGWTFAIWGVIYSCLVISTIYWVSGLFRKSSVDLSQRLYTSINWPSKTFYIVFCSNLVFNVIWLFMWDRQFLTASLVMLFLVWLSAVFMFGLVPRTRKQLSQGWYIFQTIIVRNGLGIYAAWTTVAKLLNLNALFIQLDLMRPQEGAILCLAILSLEIVVWTIMVHVFHEILAYIYSPYITFIWALSGALVTTVLESGGSSILSITLSVQIALVTLCLFIHIGRNVIKM